MTYAYRLKSQDLTRIITKRKKRWSEQMQYSRFLPKDYFELVRCHKCRRILEVGDNIVSANGMGNNGNRKHYHNACWKSMFV